MKLYTIGFTQKSAEQFFTLLQTNGVKRVVDIRLRGSGQLAGFAKQTDLPYFLKHLIKCDYTHLESLAPTDDILDGYRKDKDWRRYIERFEALMDERDIPNALDKSLFEKAVCCLLCSEATPEQCHRRLVAERLARTWKKVTILHLT
jgi:uncharacterized protein (DUF488 family)